MRLKLYRQSPIQFGWASPAISNAVRNWNANQEIETEAHAKVWKLMVEVSAKVPLS